MWAQGLEGHAHCGRETGQQSGSKVAAPLLTVRRKSDGCWCPVPLFAFFLQLSRTQTIVWCYSYSGKDFLSQLNLSRPPIQAHLELVFIGDSKSRQADTKINHHSEFLCGSAVKHWLVQLSVYTRVY